MGFEHGSVAVLEGLDIVLGTGILDSGVTYRIQVRATYEDGGANANNQPWSGPWTEPVTATMP